MNPERLGVLHTLPAFSYSQTQVMQHFAQTAQCESQTHFSLAVCQVTNLSMPQFPYL